MENITFKSILSMEEIEKNFTEIDYFSVLMESLKEILDVSKEKDISRLSKSA